MVKNTLNVGSITEGFVLDHIEAGIQEYERVRPEKE